MTNLTLALSSPVMPGFIYRLGTERQAAWRHLPRSPPLLRAESLSPCTRPYQAQPRGDSVTPPPRHSYHLPLQPCSCLPLSLPCWAEPGVLSVPDSYQVTLKHKRVERRNRRKDRQNGDGNTNRVGGDGYWLSSSVIMLSIFTSLLLLYYRLKSTKGEKK